MLVFRFGSTDLAHIRFAISPLVELQRSVRALDDPGAQAIHLPWIAAARASTRDVNLDLLRALQPRGVYSPDFNQPPPSSPLTELEDELAEMLATPADEVRAEVEFVYRRTGEPEILKPFLDEPDAAVARLTDVIREYWQRALAPYWERIRGLLRGDVFYRGRRLADGGARLLFSDLNPEASFADDELRIEKRWDATRTLDGRGLLLVPSAFTWPVISAITEPPWQPTLVYPARGVGLLWEPGEAAAPAALRALLGRRRAAVLAALDAPRPTAELAQRLGLSAPSVSQHLGVLKDAGLVHASRVGRLVLYARTQRGDGLLGAQNV
jgi:DNA-binding transcriptional ArsR family regulator